jgi:hypothetical protein
MREFAIAVGALLAPTTAAAHPDHVPGGDFGLVHHLTDPFHLWTAALIGLGVALAWVALRRARSRDPAPIQRRR